MSIQFSSASCPRRAGRLALTLIACALILAACGAPPSAVSPVLASNAEATAAIANAYAHDLAWLRQSIAASLQTQRTILLGQTHRALITDALITPLGHDPEALHNQLDAATAGGEPPTNPLITEVIAGHFTRAQAERFLNDYAVAASMSPEQSRAIRHTMLTTLAPLREHDAGAQTILNAFDHHAARIAELFNELNANNQTLANAFDPQQRPPSPFNQRSFWLPILDHIEDPHLRATAEQLLTSTLTPTTQ